MKAFSVMRYLRQFSILILVGVLAGEIGVYSYCNSRQTYTAEATIRYTNNGISSGLAANGEPLNVEEIYDSEVVTRVIERLNLQDMPDYLRSRCYVEEVIPEEQKTLNQLLLAKGEEPAYFADTYTVRFVVDDAKDSEYARDVLDAILGAYCEYYSEKYIEQRRLPDGTADLAGKNDDFLEMATVLERITREMLDYLMDKAKLYPDFRASSTGYSFSDLCDIYRYFHDYDIPRLYAMILSQAQSKDVEMLVKRLTNEIENYQLSIQNKQDQIASLNVLIENFSRRNQDQDHSEVDASQTEYILGDVEYRRDAMSSETTYDSLLQEYVDLKTSCEYDRIALEHDQYLLSVFERMSGDETGRVQMSAAEIQQELDDYAVNLNRYYALVDDTSRELNGVMSAKYLQMLSTVRVSQAINVKLYMLLALVLFAIVGCGGAIVLGRGLDLLAYLLYVDRRVDLPNRTRCDMFIDEQSKRLLPEEFSCLFIAFEALYRYSGQRGRAVGDEVMRDFAAILRNIGSAYGFVGYNGAGQFIAFFPDCPAGKARTILTVLAREAQEYNELNPDRALEYTCGLSNSTEDGEYEIRGLLRLAVRRARQNDANRPTDERTGSGTSEPDENGRSSASGMR